MFLTRHYSGISKCSEVIKKAALDIWTSSGSGNIRTAYIICQACRSFSPSWLLSFPLSLSLSLKVICNGFLKLFTQDVNRLLCVFGPVWEIHDHLLGRGGFWHSDLPSFSLWIACCAGSEWTQFIIRSIHQAYSVGTNCQCNHQRRERSSRFVSFLDPSFSPAQQKIPSSTGQYLMCIYNMDNMLVPSLTLV